MSINSLPKHEWKTLSGHYETGIIASFSPPTGSFSTGMTIEWLCRTWQLCLVRLSCGLRWSRRTSLCTWSSRIRSWSSSWTNTIASSTPAKEATITDLYECQHAPRFRCFWVYTQLECYTENKPPVMGLVKGFHQFSLLRVFRRSNHVQKITKWPSSTKIWSTFSHCCAQIYSKGAGRCCPRQYCFVTGSGAAYVETGATSCVAA